MSKQIHECPKAFDCYECKEIDDCKKWEKLKNDERIEAKKLSEEMPIIIEYFGYCGLRSGTIENWQEILASMGFGC